MNRKTTHLKRAGAGLSIAIALIAPAAAQAGSGPEAPPAGPGIQAPAAQRAEAETARGGLDRHDAAIGAAILAGVVVMGMWGYVVVGAAIAGVAAVLGAGARLATGKPRGGRGWSDWPGTATAGLEKQQGRHRPLRRPRERKPAPVFAHLERARDAEPR